MKELGLTKSVYELTEAHPELIGIMKELGFAGVVNPLVRNTLGRKMTLPQGCQKMGKDMAQVMARLTKNGFSVKAGTENAAS